MSKLPIDEMLYKFSTETLGAVNLLDKKGFMTQGLVVLYSAIDTLAWVNLPSGDVTRTAFKDWVDQYMLSTYPLPCTAEDLYAARCALLHSHTAESKSSREGNARQIFYYGKDRSKEWIDSIVDGQTNVVVVRALDIKLSFGAGVQAFAMELLTDVSRAKQVRDRIRLWMAWIDLSEGDPRLLSPEKDDGSDF